MSSVPRFFVPPTAIDSVEGVITLPADTAHHARNVLRLRVGEPIVVHDGTGMAYRCQLTDVTPGAVIAVIEEAKLAGTEPGIRITVAQGLPKTPDKVEQVLQHGTEVGATGFVLFGAQRSVAKLEGGDKLGKRVERWSAIVRGAAEQSGRAVLPSVEWAPNSAALASAIGDYDVALVLHESAVVSLRAALAIPSIAEATRLLLVIGPEGGLTDDEVKRFASAGATVVTLGPRVLRTETAALVGLSQILYARDVDPPL